jgi:TolB-like protein
VFTILVSSLYHSSSHEKAMTLRRSTFVAACLLVLASGTVAGQTKFYQYYSDGLDYVEKKDWLRALQEFRSAVSMEFEDAARKRTYGTRFIEYYPHREIGICHYYLGEKQNALKELELSSAYESSERASEYLDLLRGTAPAPAPVVTERPKPQNDRSEEPSRMETSRSTTLPVGALTYDPSRVTQVGSRLGVAVIPIELKGDMARYGDALTEKMVTQLVNLRRFKVIERASLDKVLSEQRLQVSGAVDEATAVQVGRIAGADAIILTTATESRDGGKVNARVIDTETSETIVARSEQVTGTDEEDFEKAVEALAITIYNELPIVEGFIVSREADIFYIDVGSAKGIRKGSKCVAFRDGKEIKHPTTGEVLGKQVTKLGELVVVQVQQKVAQVRVVDKEQEIKIGDKIVVK